jgi:hypothetical protein
MSTSLNSLVADFERQLDDIEESSLQRWQFAYKRVVFAMGLKILETFPRNALGPEPLAEGHGGSGDGGSGGGEYPAAGGEHSGTAGRGGFPIYHPATGPWGPIIHVWLAAMELGPPPPT